MDSIIHEWDSVVFLRSIVLFFFAAVAVSFAFPSISSSFVSTFETTEVFAFCLAGEEDILPVDEELIASLSRFDIFIYVVVA